MVALKPYTHTQLCSYVHTYVYTIIYYWQYMHMHISTYKMSPTNLYIRTYLVCKILGLDLREIISNIDLLVHVIFSLFEPCHTIGQLLNNVLFFYQYHFHCFLPALNICIYCSCLYVVDNIVLRL